MQSTNLGVGPNDVLLGRGGATNNHGGNHNFRLLVAANQPEYLKARKHEKVFIARRVVAEIKSRGGRFLQNGLSKDNWVEVSDKRAQEKTSQALREGLDVRNNKLRPNKLIKAVQLQYESSTQHPSNTAPTLKSNNMAANGNIVTPKMSPLNHIKQNQHGLQDSNNLHLPSLKEESSEPTHLMYQRRPISKHQLKHSCEV